jgi:pimeloyl-ACP methyl ester carboxylesterase
MGYDVVSFSYTGHGRSTGRFFHAAAIQDTTVMLRIAAEESRRDGLPMAGIACCYAAIPLICSNSRVETPLQKLVLINAVFELSARAALSSFLRYYHEIHGRRRPLMPFREVFRRYLDFMFPNVRKTRHNFGRLHRRRIRLLRTLVDVFWLRPLDAVREVRTRALCLYGREDNVLRLYGPGHPVSYERSVRRILPAVEFQPLPGDHFLSSPYARDETLGRIRSFFDQ